MNKRIRLSFLAAALGLAAIFGQSALDKFVAQGMSSGCAIHELNALYCQVGTVRSGMTVRITLTGYFSTTGTGVGYGYALWDGWARSTQDPWGARVDYTILIRENSPTPTPAAPARP